MASALTDGVVTGEAIARQHSLDAGDPVIHAQGSGEVLHHLLVPAPATHPSQSQCTNATFVTDARSCQQLVRKHAASHAACSPVAQVVLLGAGQVGRLGSLGGRSGGYLGSSGAAASLPGAGAAGAWPCVVAAGEEGAGHGVQRAGSSSAASGAGGAGVAHHGSRHGLEA